MGATVMLSTRGGFACRGVHAVCPSSSKKPQKRSHDFLLLHASRPLAKQSNCCISRREWLALGICIAENVCTGTFISDKHQRADAEDNASGKSNGSDGAKKSGADDSPLNGLLSLFDPKEKAKSGKLLPKSYLKSARNVVKSLKESLKEESKKESDVRKSADQAKEAIRDYLQNWRGQKAVESEESYKALEGAIKILGKFYAKQGPRAVLPSDVKSEILTNLEVAGAAL
ncbi:hypothetical protein L7F22_004876 [Adiantum nelumboides]|nr:hypothetical protein [Adiantum nelumboides]